MGNCLSSLEVPVVKVVYFPLWGTGEFFHGCCLNRMGKGKFRKLRTLIGLTNLSLLIFCVDANSTKQVSTRVFLLRLGGVGQGTKFWKR